jgi:hypothetical protein
MLVQILIESGLCHPKCSGGGRTTPAMGAWPVIVKLEFCFDFFFLLFFLFFFFKKKRENKKMMSIFSENVAYSFRNSYSSHFFREICILTKISYKPVC